MNILFIGSGDLVKSAIPYFPIEKNHLTITTTTKEKAEQLRSQFPQIEVSILEGTHLESVKKMITGKDAVVIAVAPIKSRVRGKSSDEIQQVILDTYKVIAQNVARAVQDLPKKPKVIYISAYTVYPNVDGKIVDEQTPLMRRHPKVNIMIDAEEVILDQIPHSVVLRLGWLVNPGLDWHKTLENFRKFLPNYELKGDGKIRANLVHIEDAARAIEFAISNNLSGIYNICDDAHPYTGELYDIVAEQVGMPPPNWNKEAKEVLIYEGNNIASNQKIKDAGFSFKYPREMGLLYILPNK